MVKFNYPLPEIISSQETGEYFGPENEYLLRQLNSLLTQKQNIHGRRIGKAKDAISPGDYVTKRQLNGTLVGTLAQRPQPANVVVGTTYFATDRNVTYIQRGGHWYYYTGIQDVTLSPDTKPSLSILYDSGYMIYSTDFDWYYRWNLITWERLGGTNRFIQGFTLAPTKPGWALCDGGVYTCSTDSGGTSTVTPLDMVGVGASRFLKFGSTVTAVAASAPTISGSTGNNNVGHTHSVTAAGTIVGNLPSHKHVISGDVDGGTGKIAVSFGRQGTGTGTAWSISGTSSGVSEAINLNHVHYISSIPVTVGATTSTITMCQTIPAVDVALHNHTHDGTAGGGSTEIETEDFNAVQATITEIAFTDTSEDHFHNLEGETGVLSASVANGLTFSGSSVTSGGESTTHTHTGSSLTVSNDGTPLAIQLIPYIRL